MLGPGVYLQVYNTTNGNSVTGSGEGTTSGLRSATKQKRTPVQSDCVKSEYVNVSLQGATEWRGREREETGQAGSEPGARAGDGGVSRVAEQASAGVGVQDTTATGRVGMETVKESTDDFAEEAPTRN